MTKTCTKCNKTKPITDFYRNKNRKDGRAPSCKKCADVMTATSRKQKTQQYNRYREKRRLKILSIIQEWKTKIGCVTCDEREAICLDLHHIHSNNKEIHPSRLVGMRVERMMAEFAKCTIVCKNCHTKIHAGLMVEKEIDTLNQRHLKQLEQLLLQNIKPRN